MQPIVFYGAEIWGLESCSSVLDNVHLFGLNCYLGVYRRTPNDLVYGEVGRFPIQINACVRCIRYWLKLMRMEEHRLPLRAYKMLCNLDQRVKTNWVTNVRKRLCANGFSYVWDNQGVGCLNAFIREFRQRLIDIRWKLGIRYNTIQLYCLCVEKFAFWLVIFIKLLNTVNNKISTTQ